MVKFFKRRKLFDEDADWVPAKGRSFTMKKNTEPTETQNEAVDWIPSKEGPLR